MAEKKEKLQEEEQQSVNDMLMADLLDLHYIEPVKESDKKDYLESDKDTEIESFIAFLMKNKRKINNYNTHLNDQIDKKGLDAKQVQLACCDRADAEKERKDATIVFPHNRTFLLRFACYLGYSIDETNRLLLEYGNFHALYVKSAEDCIYMYMLYHGGSKRPKSDFNSLHERVMKRLPFLNEQKTMKIKKRGEKFSPKGTLILFNDFLNHLTDVDSLIEFISANQSEYDLALRTLMDEIDGLVIKTTKRIKQEQQDYRIVYDYVRDLLLREDLSEDLKILLRKLPQRRDEELPNFTTETANSLFFRTPTFKKTHSNAMGIKVRRHIHPVREYLITLGVHLDLSNAQISNLLELAHYNPLQFNDELEAAIYFALLKIEETAPSFFLEHLHSLSVAIINNRKKSQDLNKSQDLIKSQDFLKKLKYFLTVNDFDIYNALTRFGLSYVVSSFLAQIEEVLRKEICITDKKQVPTLDGTSFTKEKMKKLLWDKVAGEIKT